MVEQFQDGHAFAPFALQLVLVGIGAEAKGELGGWMRMVRVAQERGRADCQDVFMVPPQLRSGGDRVLPRGSLRVRYRVLTLVLDVEEEDDDGGGLSLRPLVLVKA
jgi:hypothetical protein